MEKYAKYNYIFNTSRQPKPPTKVSIIIDYVKKNKGVVDYEELSALVNTKVKTLRSTLNHLKACNRIHLVKKQKFSRADDILQLINDSKHPVSLGFITESLGIPPSSAHYHLTKLKASGMIANTPKGQMYCAKSHNATDRAIELVQEAISIASSGNLDDCIESLLRLEDYLRGEVISEYDIQHA